MAEQRWTFWIYIVLGLNTHCWASQASSLDEFDFSKQQREESNLGNAGYLGSKAKDFQKAKDLGEFLSAIRIESDGFVTSDKVIIKMSFPSPAEFAWVLTNARAETVYTRGRYESVSSTIFTWLTMDNLEFEIYNIHMHVTTTMGTLVIRFNKNTLHYSGEMRMKNKGSIMDVPDEIKIGEDGTARFVVAMSQTQLLDLRSNALHGVVYTYVDTSSSIPSIEKEPVYTTISHEILQSGMDDAQNDLSEDIETLALQFSPNAQMFSGTVSMPATRVELDVETDSEYMYTHDITAQHSIQVVPFSYSDSNAEGVAFVDFKMAISTRRSLASVTHGSIDCAAAGSQRPEVRIRKNGTDLNTFEFEGYGIKKRIVHQLDGKSLLDVEGVYTCVATCGHMTISRNIMAKAFDGEVVWWRMS